MSVQLMPSKRSHDRGRKDRNGKRKLQKSSDSPCTTVFRVLWPASRIGSVIGKGGSIVKKIREETGAKVRVVEAVPGCDDRVIFISSSDKDNEFGSEGTKEDAEEINTKEESDKASAEDDDKDQKSNPVGEDLQPEKGKSSAQKALLLVFQKIVEGESKKNGGEEGSDKSANILMRLLVFSSQVGSLLGRGGGNIKQMSSESGAQIRILSRDEVPPPASPTDQLVQISGDVDAVRIALDAVSQNLLENPPRDEDVIAIKPAGPSSHSLGNERVIPGRMNPRSNILTFRMLCHNDRIGGVIGRGGNIIKMLQKESGCEIRVLERDPGSDECIIAISGQAHPDERISAPQDAVLRVQTMIFRAISNSKENTVPAKLLVSSNQIGCLLGKGGGVIAEMRKLSGAHIRILGKDQLPSCASEEDEVVQIHGGFDAVQDALLHVTTRLMNHFFADAFPSMNYPSNTAFPVQAPPFLPYAGMRDPSPPIPHPGLGPPLFHKFDGVGGLPAHGGFHPHDDRAPFMHGSGVPPHISERKPPSMWAPPGLHESVGPVGFPDFAGGPQRQIGGLGGGSHHAIITNISVQVVVPRACVDAIYGEGGGCLKQIREFSEAKITIPDPKPGASETLIKISGTPEQTHAAQSLIQAFVMMESEAS